MASLQLPASLKSLCQTDPHVSGATVGEGLTEFVARSPRLKTYLFDGGQLRPFVVVLKNGRDIKGLDGLRTEITETDTLRIVASVAGG